MTIFRLRHNRKYTTFVNTGHGFIRVEFEPIVLFSRVENSIYSTSDDEVIAALKSRCEFGSLFYVEEDGQVMVSKAIDPVGPSKVEDPTDDNKIHDKSVTSKNKAIAFLLDKFGETFASTANIEAMKKEALEKYNVVFDSWNS